MQGLTVLLEAEPSTEVVGKAEIHHDPVVRYQKFKPDVIIMNLCYKEELSIKSSRLTMDDHQQAKLIGLASDYNLPLIQDFIKMGASGCLTYDCELEELVEAIHVVAEGGFHLCPKISNLLINEFKMGNPASAEKKWAALNDREKTILLELLGSKAIKEIAADLGLSPNTIYVLKRQIMKKIGVKTIAELTKMAIRDGVLPV